MNYLTTNFKDFIKHKISEAVMANEEQERKTDVSTMVKEMQAEYEKIMKEYDDLYKQ